MEVDEVASERLREETAEVLKSWFPSIDLLKALELLKQDKSVLIEGVDEDSAKRIVAALKSMKVGSRMAGARDPLWKHLFNPGLIISAASLVLAPFLGLLAKFLLLLIALGAPVVGALIKIRKLRPLVAAPSMSSRFERWVDLAADYAEVVPRLQPEESDALKQIAMGVFDLRTRLSGGTLAAVAAGEQRGEFYDRLFETILTAVDVARRIARAQGDWRAELRKELNSLRALTEKTGEWFRSLEQEGVKGAPELEGDLADIMRSIDSLVQEVRSPAAGYFDETNI